MHSSEDLQIKALLQRQWPAPPASPEAGARLLAAARATPRRGSVGWRWALPGAAVAATALASLWTLVPGERAPITPASAVSVRLTDEDMMSYVFATYTLEETL